MFNLKKKQEEPVISFLTRTEGMLETEDILPKPSKAFIPEWWAKMPRNDEKSGITTVKMCPSFPEYFSQGYILPAWADAELTYTAESDSWFTREAKSDGAEKNSQWTIHPNSQLLSHVTPLFRGNKPTMVFKGESPWNIITKHGWSVLQVPLFYHFNNDIVAMPGVIDTDIEHELSLQMLYFGDGKTIKIKRGQPLVQYIPFKRSERNISLDVREPNENDLKKINRQSYYISTKFEGTGAYRKMQKERDRNV